MSSYSAAVLADTPGAYWRMGESSGDFADSSGNGNTAVVTPTITLGVAGAIVGDPNKAALFNGSTGFATATRTASIDASNTFTVHGWIKRVGIGALQNVLDTNNGAAGLGYQIRFNAGDFLELIFADIAVIVGSTLAISDTVSWHHIAITKAGLTTVQYIDGADVTGTVTNQTILASTNNVLIGKYGAGNSRFWNGAMDELVIKNDAALSAQDIADFNTEGRSSEADDDDRRRRR